MWFNIISNVIIFELCLIDNWNKLISKYYYLFNFGFQRGYWRWSQKSIKKLVFIRELSEEKKLVLIEYLL